MIGQRVKNYRIMRQLGEGGMGTAYEAIHEYLGRRVAIKFINMNLVQNDDLAQRFLTEGLALSRLADDPGIVRFLEWGKLPTGPIYLILELIEGKSLSSHLHGQRSTLRQCGQIARQLAASCAFAHKNNIIHRDLKPDNVLLQSDSAAPGGVRTKLLDFGIAKAFDGVPLGHIRTQPNMLIGTPRYMSPEQCRGAGQVGPESDVYSLGLILYEMMAYTDPFLSENKGMGELLAERQFAVAAPVTQHNPAVPTRLSRFLETMLAKDPQARPTMAEVVQELDELLRTDVLDRSTVEHVVPPHQDSFQPPTAIAHGPAGQPPRFRKSATFWACAGFIALLAVGFFVYRYVTALVDTTLPTSHR